MNAKDANKKLFEVFENTSDISYTMNIIYSMISSAINDGSSFVRINFDIFGNCFKTIKIRDCDGGYIDTLEEVFSTKQLAIVKILKSKGYKVKLPDTVFYRDYLYIEW